MYNKKEKTSQDTMGIFPLNCSGPKQILSKYSCSLFTSTTCIGITEILEHKLYLLF